MVSTTPRSHILEAVPRARIAFALVCMQACADGSGEPRDADVPPGSIEVALDPCEPAEPVAGSIDVSTSFDSFHGAAVAKVSAELEDAPKLRLHEVAATQGTCRHLRAAVGFCDPPCSSGDACTLDDECQPYPLGISGGTLTIDGLARKLVIAPEERQPGVYTGPAGLPAELFDAGDVITATLGGDGFAAASFTAQGVAAIDATLTLLGLDLVDGQDTEITWTPGPDQSACVLVTLNGSNQLHGAPLEDIVQCVGPDTGSMIVAEALVEALPYGDTPEVTEGYDWPHSELTRYTRHTRETQHGAASLVVRSTAYFRLRHAN